jgi:hypothetical protein
VLGPGEPAVPFTVPLLDIEPAAVLPEPVPPPEAPPEPPPPACASAEVLVKTSAATKRNLEDFNVDSYANEQTPQLDLVPNGSHTRTTGR